jgi:capsular polysaccharide biosynthesis protein
MTYLNILKNKWQTIALTTLVFVVLSLVLTILQPFEYRSKVDLLVIQKQAQNLDAYASARAAEKIALNLAQVVETKSFFNAVIEGNFGINKYSFPSNEIKLRKEWQKKVDIKIIPETSILSINVYDEDKKEANKIATGIAYTLVNNSENYHGGGKDVVIKVVNEPLVSENPAKPKIFLNLLLGLIAGLILSTSYVFYKYHTKLEQAYSEKYFEDKINHLKN